MRHYAPPRRTNDLRGLVPDASPVRNLIGEAAQLTGQIWLCLNRTAASAVWTVSKSNGGGASAGLSKVFVGLCIRRLEWNPAQAGSSTNRDTTLRGEESSSVRPCSYF